MNPVMESRVDFTGIMIVFVDNDDKRCPERGYVNLDAHKGIAYARLENREELLKAINERAEP